MDKLDYHQLVGSLKAKFESGLTRSVDFRLTQLKALLRLYEENNDLILQSLHRDMRKSKLEGYLYEVDLMKNDVRTMISNVKSWAKNVKVHRNLLTPADHAYYSNEPYGLVLVIGPWNYPWQLTLVPLSGAIAAGNVVIIKPSEVSMHSAQTMAELIPKYLHPDCYKVVLGGPTETEQLLQEHFDYIFYTGSREVGKRIHAKANMNLTPVTLELGGKSPTYVDKSVNYAMTARRLMWGKTMNAGQTCVAPDYVLCSKEVEHNLVQECKIVMDEWYGKNWKSATDFARIINARHFNRIKKLIDGHNIVMGGDMDEDDLYIAPTLIVDVKETDAIMQDEIFGPVLPFMTVNSEEEAIRFVNSRPDALCMYVFSESEVTQQRFQNATRSGTMAFNDCVIQFAIDALPFGSRGLGQYHGAFSFDTFTHKKSIVRRDFSFIGDKVGSARYPPYTKFKINGLSFLLCHWKKFRLIHMDLLPFVLSFLIGFVFAYTYYFFH